MAQSIFQQTTHNYFNPSNQTPVTIDVPNGLSTTSVPVNSFYNFDWDSGYGAGVPTGYTPPVTGNSFIDYLKSPSIINASVTMALGGLGSLIGALSSRKIYKLYEEQERLQIEAAEIQAKRLERKGKIALENLISQHALAEGKNELSVASSGAGSISGSFLDKLMANKKYNSRDEFSQELDTLWAASNARRQGYMQAYSTAGYAVQKAYQDRNSALGTFIRGISGAVDSITKDIQQQRMQEAQAYAARNNLEFERWKTLQTFLVPKVDAEKYGVLTKGPQQEAIGYSTLNLAGYDTPVQDIATFDYEKSLIDFGD